MALRRPASLFNCDIVHDCYLSLESVECMYSINVLRAVLQCLEIPDVAYHWEAVSIEIANRHLPDVPAVAALAAPLAPASGADPVMPGNDAVVASDGVATAWQGWDDVRLMYIQMHSLHTHTYMRACMHTCVALISHTLVIVS